MICVKLYIARVETITLLYFRHRCIMMLRGITDTGFFRHMHYFGAT